MSATAATTMRLLMPLVTSNHFYALIQHLIIRYSSPDLKKYIILVKQQIYLIHLCSLRFDLIVRAVIDSVLNNGRRQR